MMIKPAMTAKEWAKPKGFENRATGEDRGLIEFGTVELVEYANGDGVWNGLHVYRGGLLCNVNAPNLQALAALCLHGQAFGFTREDVAGIREAVKQDEAEWGPHEDDFRHPLIYLADRIEALLPPEGE